MNTPKERITPEDVEGLLSSTPTPTPPMHLLEDLKSEIPSDLEVSNEPPRGKGPRPQTWLLAATLATVAFGGFLAYRLGETNHWRITPSLSDADRVSPGTTATREQTNRNNPMDVSGDTQEAKSVEISGAVTRDREDLEGEQTDDLKADVNPTPPTEGRVADRFGDSTFDTRAQSMREHLLERQELELPTESSSSGPASVTGANSPSAQLQVETFSSPAQISGDPTLENQAFSVLESNNLDPQEPVRHRHEPTSINYLVDNEPGTDRSTILTVLQREERRLREELEALQSGTHGRSSRQEPPRADMILLPKKSHSSVGGTAEPNDRPYDDMFFDSYGTNPFIDTEDDHQSTFAMDVDTGSYTVARSYLDRGHLPPQDAIRVEEFLNYFNYNDQAPRHGDFALSAEGAPSPFASGERQYLLRFGIQGREIHAEDRDPATLIFVVDVSGSMDRENRLGLVKESLRLLLGELTPSDRVGLVVYGNRGQVLLQPTSNHQRIERAINRLVANGSTNAEEGLVLAYDLAREYYREGAINRVILCSDGVANVGRTGPDSILNRIGREADAGVELTTVGFGMGNYNDVLMEQLADKGDGRYSYVDDISEARRLFVEQLTGTLQTIASEAKIQVEFDPQVVSRYRLIGYENRDVADRDFRNDKVDAGEIGAGHHITALYEIKLHEDTPRNTEVATLRVRYHSKERGRVIEQKQPVHFNEFDARLRSSAPSLRLAALVAEFGEILKGSFWAKDGDLKRVAAGARELARETRDPKVAEFRDLVKTAAMLRDSGQVNPDWIDE